VHFVQGALSFETLSGKNTTISITKLSFQNLGTNQQQAPLTAHPSCLLSNET